MERATTTVGIIGLGDMGAMYARRFAAAGWKVVACDRPEVYAATADKFAEEAFTVVENGHLVSRVADYVIYSVEAANIDAIVRMYGPLTKVGAVVGGQTLCKQPEIDAFVKYLPADTHIVTMHLLHGPAVDPRGQPLVIIRYRASDEAFAFAQELLSCFESKTVQLTASEHDRITADTQAVTHAAFLLMGVAWSLCNQYPWETLRWVGGIENAKINILLRIFSNKWHVYAGLAMTNPAAHEQVFQYAKLVTQLYTLMVEQRWDDLRARVERARENVFGHLGEHHRLLLDDALLAKYLLGKLPPGGRQPNLHLLLLGIVDLWLALGIVPYDHMICSTPLFRIFLGVSEYLFCTPELLEETLAVGVRDTTFRHDDLEFTIAARQWLTAVRLNNIELYRSQFETTQKFFAPMLPEATRVGNEMMKTILTRSQGLDTEA